MICRTFCKNCGQSVPDGAKFCGNCGTRVQEEPKNSFCSSCGAQLEPGAQFCAACGMKVGSSAAPGPGPRPEVNSVTTAKGTGRLLTSMKLASLYEGEPKVGVAKASGLLSIYDDRLEFKKQLGSALGNAFGLVGMAVARNKTKDDPVLIYPLSQIAQLRTGKYGGVYNTLVVVLRDGTTISFCPAAPASSAPQSIVETLKQYM